MAFGLASINWQAPWLAPLAEKGRQVADQAEQWGSVARALNQHTAPVQFVPQAQLPTGTAYEAYIAATDCCPTRDGLHDFFNGLLWLHMPLTKRLLNRWQAQDIAQHGVGQHRGPLRDALTLFDENVALLACTDDLWQALEQRQWERLMVTLRAQWAEADLLLFGHALMEKLVAPRKGMCAHVLRVPKRFANPADLDQQLAQWLTPAWLATKPYRPLPVLGVPGWWPDNQDPGFYQDPQVFRPARQLGLP